MLNIIDGMCHIYETTLIRKSTHSSQMIKQVKSKTIA